MAELIEEIVGQKAYDQVDKLTTKIVDLSKYIDELNAKSRGIEINIKNAKTIEETVQATKELDTVTKSLGKTYETFASTSNEVDAILKDFSGTVDQNVRLQAQYKIQLDAVSKQMASLKKDYTDGKVTSEQYTAALAGQLARQTEIKIALGEISTAIKAETKERQAATGSVDQMSQRLGRLRDTYRQLSEEDRNGAVGQALLKTIQELDPAVKEIDASLGNFQRNVGNYPQGFNVAVKTLQQARAELQALAAQLPADSEAAQTLQQQIKQLDVVLESSETKLLSNRAALKSLQNVLVEVEVNLGKDSQAFQQVSKIAGGFKDDIDDASAAIKHMASDTKTIDGVIGAVQALAGSFALVQGTAALFGNEDKELEKTMQKLQATMVILQGLQQIANALQKESAAMLLATNVQTKALAAATTLYTWVMGAATTATKVFRAALVATGIGAFVVLLGLLYEAYEALTDGTDAAAKAQKEYNDALIEGYDRAAAYNKKLVELDVARAKSVGASEDAIAQIQRNGREAQKAIAVEQLADLQKRYAALEDISTENAKAIAKQVFDAAEKVKALTIENETADLNDRTAHNNRILTAQSKSDKAATDAAKKALEERRRNADAARKAEIDSQKMLAEATATQNEAEYKADQYLQQNIFDNVKNSLDDRIAAYEQYWADQTTLNGISLGKELSNTQEVLNQIAKIENKSASERSLAEKTLLSQKEAYQKQYLAIVTNASVEQKKIDAEKEAKLREIAKTAADELVRIEKEKLDDIAHADNTRMTEQLQALSDQHVAGLLSDKKYEQSKSDIAYKGTMDRLENQRLELTTAIENNRAKNIDTSNLEKELDNLDEEYTKKKIDRQEELRNRRIEKEKEIIDAIAKYAKEAADTVQGVTEGLTQRRINQIDSEISKIEDKKQADIDAVNASTASQEQKQQQIDAINKKAAADEEKLNEKKRQEQIKQAKLDKGIAIAKLTIDLAQAVGRAFHDYPWPASIAAAAAAGAPVAEQLAVAIATPIPQYAEGTPDEGHPGGPAILGDGYERELVQEPGRKAYWSKNIPSVYNLKAGTHVTPESDIMDYVRNALQVDRLTYVESDRNAELIEELIESQKKGSKDIVNAVRSQKQPRFTNNDRYNYYFHKRVRA